MVGAGLVLTAALLCPRGSPRNFYFPVDNGIYQPNNIFMLVKTEGPVKKMSVKELADKVLEEAKSIKPPVRTYGNRFFITPNSVRKHMSGRCIEQTTLALESALISGFDASPKVFMVEGQGNLRLNHMLLSIKDGGSEYFLDPYFRIFASGNRDYLTQLSAKLGANITRISVYPCYESALPKFVATEKGEKEARSKYKPEFVIQADQ